MELTLLTIRDQTIFGSIPDDYVLTLGFPSDRISVRELIRERVYQEVKEYNARHPEYYRGLVQPNEAEQTLNGYRLHQRRPLDWEQQFDQATRAFQRNGFILLVDEIQYDDLDAMIEIKPETTVTFLKLIPLVGG